MSWDDHLRQHRRLAIIGILAEAPSSGLNDAILHVSLADIGEPCARDQVRSELAWLKEQGLVAIEAAERFMIASLTERGEDVAKGRATHPGVTRPLPKS